MQLQQQALTQITQYLLQSPIFISTLLEKLTKKNPTLSEQIQETTEQISQLINILIHKKLQIEMEHLIADNNAILQQIKSNFQRNSLSTTPPLSATPHRSNDASFTEIHNLITQQKKKMLEQLGQNQQGDKSMTISMLGQYDDIVEKVNEINKKVKAMEDKYQTNFKSLWNVLSMTESAVFDFIRDAGQEKKQKKERKDRDKDKEDKGIFSFWK